MSDATKRASDGAKTDVRPAKWFTIWADTREKSIPPFPDGVKVERVTLGEADYTTERLQGLAIIERKSGGDFVSSITHDRERFEDELRRLRGYRWRCVVVEEDLSAVYRLSKTHPHAILGTVASLYARWDCPVLFGCNPAGAGRLIAGVLRRWEERLVSEQAELAAVPRCACADPDDAEWFGLPFCRRCGVVLRPRAAA